MHAHLVRAAHLDALGLERGNDGRQQLGGGGALDEQRLDRVAGGGVLDLGVDAHAHGQVHVGGLVHVDVADAVGVAHHGNAGVVHDVAHEGVGAARDEQVDQAVAAQQLADLLAGLRLEQTRVGQTRLDGSRVDDVEERLVGAHGLAAALEDGAVAALEAQGRDLHERVGTRLEDDADHADGAAHAHQREALVELAGEQRATDRVGQADGVVDAGADVGQLVLVEAQALDHGRGHAVSLGGGEVPRVGGKDRVAVGEQRLLDVGECGIAHLDRRGRHDGALELHTCGDSFPDRTVS